MGVGDDEADVVHDSADVRNVVVDAFQFQKNGSHSLGAFGDLDVGGLFNRLTKSNAMREARIAGNALGQIDRALHRQLLETLFDSLVDVKHAQLQVKNGLAGNREVEMARLDDAGVNRAYGKLKHAFAQGGSIHVALSFKGRQHRVNGEVFTQRMNVRPVVVQGNAAGIRMPLGHQPEPILNLAFLPVQRRDFGG